MGSRRYQADNYILYQGMRMYMHILYTSLMVHLELRQGNIILQFIWMEIYCLVLGSYKRMPGPYYEVTKLNLHTK